MAYAVPFEQLLPGVGYEFNDVTNIFVEGASELEPDSVLFMESFSLQESMSAIEIGEPRLDSGIIVQEQIRPTFDPLAPLLPEELCWILDRALAYEMEFHAGNFLAHTVHTLLYVHHVREIDPDVVIDNPTIQADPARPIELITIVLRAAVQGLLKCCDLAWRELSKGGAFDTEDWQSDKCEVSLLENMPVPYVLALLDEATEWLSQSTVPIRWRNALRARLQLRRTILQLLSTDLTRNRLEFQQLVFQAQNDLHSVQATSPIECDPDSLAQLAFDPYIGRRLQTATPIRVVPPPSFQETCEALRKFLDGMFEIGLLETVDNLSTWQIVADLRLWNPDLSLRVPYLRSLTQSTFYDGTLILNKYPFDWMIDRFFYEAVGLSYGSIKAAVTSRWSGAEADPPLRKVERSLYKLITPHIRALWNNPPRKRRHFMKALLEWHSLYDTLTDIVNNIDMEDLPQSNVLSKLPDIALSWRLSIIREVVLSGFQLELYATHERPFAYWYVAQIVETHLECLDGLLAMVQTGSPQYREMSYQIQSLTALQALCSALFVVTLPLISTNWTQVRANFLRRYKWAFRAEYEIFDTAVVAQPVLHDFMMTCGEIMEDDNVPIPRDFVDLARSILEGLIQANEADGWAGLWTKDRMEFTRRLLSTQEEINSFDVQSVKWDATSHPWFPRVDTQGSEA
ncbi:Mak10 subunit, NatC N-terminal acetyltransferase-domain-containing protein [Gymnopilus junonius]|uniref:Mak10 subunit, NatC N-terminal acetyltransferase-domain-containing protein n=1 Tax=Gymnopilus junonius TaxID=109634 RepID=A0A9P5TF23_GYMJU|nr:Mak10 subunit, NatC N-terminal acetyltransferase-domain-containing protein [Gymnopilus junonius]